MDETDYVEMAFWSGWVQAIRPGMQMDHGDMYEMMERMRSVIPEVVEDYIAEVEATRE